MKTACSDWALSYRVATVADIPAMHRVRMAVKENVLSNPAKVTPEMYVPYLQEFGKGWVCEDQGQILGLSIVDYRNGSVWALFVDPTAEQRGIGKRLMQVLVDDARRRGFVELKLSTAIDTRADRFYLRQGWLPGEVDADGERHYRLPL
ncbi:GNAT family N-acetyltransferase [Permianibacter aggregans]|uniref:N-acetylglutamate synthase-like GNAT family acetyltransferase n=1 Tax=Permianibacter aggregans TaxID=1510150 RepID=A0A4R6UX79_9GAMM|nr:GNAT family N-acetyltransferase [Permianibacter aggregans]TDQ50609.1 N-acetylglutamate synthase-like GNAT family acetyltransferase [Permianibacter aggregans]